MSFKVIYHTKNYRFMNYFPKYTIELFIENGQWFAKFSDPAIVELFETDTIETGFASDMQDKAVLTAISNLNPNSYVTLRYPLFNH